MSPARGLKPDRYTQDVAEQALRVAKNATIGNGFFFARGAVCFTWDDGHSGHLAIAQKAAELGQRHTFLITTSWLGDAGRLTSEDVATIARLGHEIGNHTVTHPDLTTLTPAQRAVEYDDATAALEDITGDQVTTFCPPFGARNDAADREQHTRFSRSLQAGGLISQHWNIPAHERGVFLVGRVGIDTEAQRLYARRLIERAARTETLVCFYGHNRTVEEALEVMQHAHDLGVPCLRADEVFPGRDILVNPSFEDELTSEWLTVATGTGKTVERVLQTPDAGISGEYALRLASTNDSDFVYAYQIVPVEWLKRYDFSFRYKTNITSGAGSVVARIRLFGPTGTFLAQESTTALSSVAWARTAKGITATTGTAFATVEFLLSGVTGEAFFDHADFGPVNLGAFG